MLLLDTDIVSFLFKADSRAQLYAPRLQGQSLAIAFMTVAELYKWPFERNWGEPRKQGLAQHLKNYIVLPYDDALAWAWAELVAKTCRARPMSLQDSWVAATALRHALPLVTHNRKHFDNVPGLTMISEA
jgi:predicted nucleic acid-binding protein